MDSDADPWKPLRAYTPARIGLKRRGDAPGLGDILAFQLAHARARDAVHAAMNSAALAAALAPRRVIQLASAAADRSIYLRRPDLGRMLGPGCAERLPSQACDLLFVVADGLSPRAVQERAPGFLAVALDRLRGWSVAPIVIAAQARVALGDEIGERMGAAMTIMLIGERPGLSVADSLGVYVTFAPRRGRKDSERNCLSNIHADGLSYARAADKLAWLVGEAMRRKLTGVLLKDDVDEAMIAAPAGGGLP